MMLDFSLRGEPHNVWIGASWLPFKDSTQVAEGGTWVRVTESIGWDVRLTLLPCFPRVIRWTRHWRQMSVRARS